MFGNIPISWFFSITVIILFIIGIYCVIVTSNLIRTIIGLEIITKAVTLLISHVGRVTGNTALVQSFIITLIIIEVVIIIVAGGIVLSVFKKNMSIDVKILRNMKE
jgi:multisubunit Na+/H+ antiporter MnhC subunit